MVRRKVQRAIIRRGRSGWVAPSVLNMNDFLCFQSRFAFGFP